MDHRKNEATVAVLAFHGALKDFLQSVNRADGVVRYALHRRASVKDVIEALGPPHACVGGLLINGEPAGFGHLLQAGDLVAVHPLERPQKVLEPTLLRPEPLESLRFMADANVGRLARELRMLGFDTAYDRLLDDADVAQKAVEEGRVVLSKDRGLMKRSKVVHAHLVLEEAPGRQLVEVLRVFGLRPPFSRAFTRCAECNALLKLVSKEAVLHKLEPKTKKYFFEFKLCPICDKVYWAGSHSEGFRRRLEALEAEMGS